MSFDGAEVEPIMISALEHWSYCRRQCGLIHLENVWDENVFTLKGSHLHDRPDQPIVRSERGRRVERALPIWSKALGLTGRADVVEFGPEGVPYPVEYKSGLARNRPHERIQLCAQALCLEEMFQTAVPEGALYYIRSAKRVPVAFEESLRTSTIVAVAGIREMLASGDLPAAIYDRRCRDCSLIDACLPQMLAGATSHSPKTFRPLPEMDLP